MYTYGDASPEQLATPLLSRACWQSMYQDVCTRASIDELIRKQYRLRLFSKFPKEQVISSRYRQCEPGISAKTGRRSRDGIRHGEEPSGKSRLGFRVKLRAFRVLYRGGISDWGQGFVTKLRFRDWVQGLVRPALAIRNRNGGLWPNSA